MTSTAPQREDLFEESLRQGQIRHALKTALACCLATALTYFFHLAAGEFAPIFVVIIMALGMPSPRLNAILGQFAIAVSAVVSALLVIAFHDVPFLFLSVTLVWIFTCLLFTSRFPLPGSMGSMVSAIGIFVFSQGTVGETLAFYVAYGIDWFVGGFSVIVVNTLIWPRTTEKVFLERLAAVYAHLEEQCRRVARQIRSGESSPVEASAEEWAPFRPLRQMLAPELRRGRDTSNPFARMILACRALNLRLRLFNQAVAPVLPAALPVETRQQLAGLVDRCAEHLHGVLQGILHGNQVLPLDAGLLQAVPLAHGTPQTVLRRVLQDIQIVTTSQNALLPSLRKGLAGELVALEPLATGTRLIDVNSLRASTKLVLIILLCLVEQQVLGFPGGTQVAFFATFFASIGNLGRQTKTDLLGLFGLLSGFVYGVVAAFFTSRLPHLPLLLSLLFLGEFLANLAYQKLQRYNIAGLQAGMALPFAYLASTGPGWGSFAGVRTRIAGIVVAGFTAMVVHAYLWPVLPMRRLRASIAAALQDTAVSLGRLFDGPRSGWEGSPPSLGETVTRARDLLDDARYLPGPDHADPAYNGILGCLQEIDANLEYVRFLLGLEEEHPLRQRFFQVIGDYAERAQGNLERVARQFQPSPGRAARVESVHWEPDASGRWESASHDVGPVPERGIDPWRPAVIARCLDQIARVVERISGIAREINLRTSGR